LGEQRRPELPDGFATAEDWQRAAYGVVFKRLRTERGWSYREFGERVGASHTALYEIERGNNTPGVELLARVAAACDLTLPALLLLTVDELQASVTGGSTLAAVLTAGADLNDQQRAELTRYAEWMRYRDGADGDVQGT
jgi:transcriptional regulator with XRE-family HTH domain